MLISQPLLPLLQRSSVHLLCLFVLSLLSQHYGAVADARQRGGMLRSQHLLEPLVNCLVANIQEIDILFYFIVLPSIIPVVHLTPFSIAY
jgi:hypothetical protein